MLVRPAAKFLATGCLLLALSLLVATCRLGELVKPTIHDRLLITPGAVLGTAHSGSRVDVTDTLRLASADGAGLTWHAVATAPWLVLSASTGGAPDTITVTLHADTLSQATRSDTIAFTAAEMPGDTIKVPVTFNVLAPAPQLSISPTARSDSAFAGSLQPRTFTVTIHNSGGLPLSWSAGPDSSWLGLTVDSGTVAVGDSTSTTISLSATALGPGTYTGAVIFDAPGAVGAPESVTVSFRVDPCALVSVTPDAAVSANLGWDDCGAPDRAGRVAKRYRVSANAGDTLSFRLSSTMFDAYLTLHDSLGTLLTENNDCPGETGPACIQEFRAPGTGRYIVEATTAAAADTGAFTLTVVHEQAPTLPQQPKQFRSDSITAIGIGATTTENVVVFKATVNDPNPRDSVRLEVEALELSSQFTGAATSVSGYVGVGQTAAIRVSGLTENSGYHWRARTCDKTLRCSAWLSFGANSDAVADFLVNAVAENPAIDALSLNQFNGAAVIPVGGGTGGGLGSSQTVTFKATVSDPDPGDVLVLEVEAKTTNTAFDGSSVVRGTGVASGATGSAAAAYTVALLGSNYHWRARACDQTSRCSAWVSFGGNSDVVTADPDFHVP